MAEYLLDTNHAASLVTFNHPLRTKIIEYLAKGDKFSICVPVLTETAYGIGIIARAKMNLEEWSRISPHFYCYVSDQDDAIVAANLRVQLRKAGWQLAAMDALIAVIGLRYDLVLLTSDNDFSQIPELKMENWKQFVS